MIPNVNYAPAAWGVFECYIALPCVSDTFHKRFYMACQSTTRPARVLWLRLKSYHQTQHNNHSFHDVFMKSGIHWFLLISRKPAILFLENIEKKELFQLNNQGKFESWSSIYTSLAPAQYLKHLICGIAIVHGGFQLWIKSRLTGTKVGPCSWGGYHHFRKHPYICIYIYICSHHFIW